MNTMSQCLADLIGDIPVIAVMQVENPKHAVPLAESLVAGGLPVIEIMLRTKAALEVVQLIAQNVPQARVGVGTVLSPEQFGQAEEAGATFAVSPDSSGLVEAALNQSLPWLPGAWTPKELHTLLNYGFWFQKFFPAAVGIEVFKHMTTPYPVRFCPTGLDKTNAPEWLKLPNVLCVGGSWMAPPELIAQERWDSIEPLAREAAHLRTK